MGPESQPTGQPSGDLAAEIAYGGGMSGSVQVPARLELIAAAQERAFWIKTLRELVTFHGPLPWSDQDYATAADVLATAAAARPRGAS